MPKATKAHLKSKTAAGHALLAKTPFVLADTGPTAPAAAAPHGFFAEPAVADVAKVFNPAAQILGDAGSSDALRILQDQTDRIKKVETLTLLRQALFRFKEMDWKGGGELSLKALHVDEKCGEAWHMLAIAQEKSSDLQTALTCYETALRLTPDNPYIANDLGRLAYRLGILDMAEKFFLFFLNTIPGHGEAINNLASVYREQNRLDEAIDILKAALNDNPADPQLWNALGTIVNARGEMDLSALFYAEALKYDPHHVHALYNYGNALAVLGDVEGALQYHFKALPLFTDAMNIHTCKLSIAFCYLHLGDYDNGWLWYEARNKDNTPEKMHYLINRPHWEDGAPLKGKRIFVSCEQGLGDEIMFASILPDLIAEVGPEGHVSIGCEPRLVPLFQKGFPNSTVYRHHTTKHKGLHVRLFPEMETWESYDYWAIMGDFLARYRRRKEDFPKTNVFFKPDPERIAHWKGVLNALNDKPKVGVLWKSLIKHSRRDRYYSPFEQWSTVLGVEGVQIVNLQYGDTTEELAEAKAMGLDIWTPPGIDLKNDLDDLSALCVALDCIMGPANATSNIAGAAGGTVWMVSPAKSWNSLGTDHFPWYPTTRVFFSTSLTDWSTVMGEMREALIETFVGKAPKAHVA